MTKRTKFIIGFWIVFGLLFIVGHKLLSNIILHYQQRPAAETTEAYQIISQYQQPVVDFYNKNQRCPTMADKPQVITEIKAYQYIKTIRLLADEQTNTCFITAVMRADTPSKSVKNGLITIAYDTHQSPAHNWSCYTNITNIYTIEACRDKPLPKTFQRALTHYTRSIK